MDPNWVWAVVVLVAVALAYDLLRRETAYIGRKDHQRLREEHDDLARRQLLDVTQLQAAHDLLEDKLRKRMDRLEAGELEREHKLKRVREDVDVSLDGVRGCTQLLTAESKTRTELREEFDGICQQWRSKVAELDAKLDAMNERNLEVVRNAKNEIAGELAAVADITKKGWR